MQEIESIGFKEIDKMVSVLVLLFSNSNKKIKL